MEAAVQAQRRGFVARSVAVIWTTIQIVAGLIAMGFAAIFWGAWIALKWTWSKAKSAHGRVGDMKRTLIGLGILTPGLFAYVYLFFAEVSALVAGPLLAWAGITMFYVVVKYGHREIDLIYELKRGNYAVAFHFRSYALLIAALLAAPVLAIAL